MGQAGATDETFGRPADIAFGPNDDLYVADGYGNSRVVKYDSKGNFVKAWGTPGSAPGEFDLVHSVAVDSQGRVYASDRENNRIQIFDADGNLLKMWMPGLDADRGGGAGRAAGTALTSDGRTGPTTVRLPADPFRSRRLCNTRRRPLRA